MKKRKTMKLQNSNEKKTSVPKTEVIEKATCKKCGTELEKDNKFCTNCEQDINPPKNTAKAETTEERSCSRCGTVVAKENNFCTNCGQKIDLCKKDNPVLPATQLNGQIAKTTNKKTSKNKRYIIGVVVLALSLGTLIFWDNNKNALTTIEEYLERGNYQEAYANAKNDTEKLRVQAENAIAIQSGISMNRLKESSSFSLSEAYYKADPNKGSHNMVLYISISNGYGPNISSYWLYTWNTLDNNWTFFSSVSDLTNEEISSTDSLDVISDKHINNAARIKINDTIANGIKLDANALNRINKMFQNNRLNNISNLNIG